MNVFVILIASVVNSIFYRLGGARKPGKWYDFLCQTKTRDFGCSLVTNLVLAYILGWNLWAFVLGFGLLFAALTTYLDSVFGYDNFYAAGLLCGLAALPWAFQGGIVPICLRALLLCLLWGIWCEKTNWDLAAEWGRGAFLTLTLLALL